MVEWIEMLAFNSLNPARLSSPPSWWSGLKFRPAYDRTEICPVSTLVVEWIEIMMDINGLISLDVSTLVVEWIEIRWSASSLASSSVSTLVVEWIEI